MPCTSPPRICAPAYCVHQHLPLPPLPPPRRATAAAARQTCPRRRPRRGPWAPPSYKRRWALTWAARRPWQWPPGTSPAAPWSPGSLCRWLRSRRRGGAPSRRCWRRGGRPRSARPRGWSWSGMCWLTCWPRSARRAGLLMRTPTPSSRPSPRPLAGPRREQRQRWRAATAAAAAAVAPRRPCCACFAAPRRRWTPPCSCPGCRRWCSTSWRCAALCCAVVPCCSVPCCPALLQQAGRLWPVLGAIS